MSLLNAEAAGERSWLRHYPAGVQWAQTITTSTVSELLSASAHRWPERLALEHGAQRWSYRQLDDVVTRLARTLAAQSLARPGAVVALWMANRPEQVLYALAALRAGATLVLLSPLDAPATQAGKLADCGASVLVADHALWTPMTHVLAGTPLQTLIHVGAEDEPVDTPPRLCLLRSDHLLAADVPQAALPPIDADMPALLQYTGGTTGVPRAAVLTHGNLTAACEQYWHITHGAPAILEDGRETLLLCLPLFHIYAFTANLLFGLRLGASILLQARFDAATVIACVGERRVTMFSGVPTMYALLIDACAGARPDLSSLRFCLSGGAPLPGETHRAFETLTGLRLTEGWGMTETASAGTYAPPTGMVKIGSCGLPIPGVDLRLVDLDDFDRPAAAGAAGELCIRGPNVMRNYLGQVPHLQGVFTADGYLRTGDIAHIDEDGYVHIVDRLKDMMLCGGYNVYPRAIEEALYAHPAVQDALVIGIPDAIRGQVPKAFVQLRPQAAGFSLDELKAFLRGRVGRHEMVQALEFRAELPRTAVGKLSKKALLEGAGEGAP